MPTTAMSSHPKELSPTPVDDGQGGGGGAGGSCSTVANSNNQSNEEGPPPSSADPPKTAASTHLSPSHPVDPIYASANAKGDVQEHAGTSAAEEIAAAAAVPLLLQGHAPAMNAVETSNGSLVVAEAQDRSADGGDGTVDLAHRRREEKEELKGLMQRASGLMAVSSS